MKRFRFVFCVGIFLSGCTSIAAARLAALPQGAIQFPAAKVAWKPAPPSLPANTEIAVLEGSPTQAGMFTLRLKVPSGTRLPAHWHPRDERVTVLSGKVRVAFGRSYDRNQQIEYGAGSFYLNPPHAVHTVEFVDESILQLTGEGPWELHVVTESR